MELSPSELGVLSKKVELSPSELGVSSKKVELSLSELGLSCSELGLSSQKVELSLSELGLSCSELGLSSKKVELSPMPNAQCPKRRGGCPSPPTRGWSFPPLSIKFSRNAPPRGWCGARIVFRSKS
ncbi:MULTISPECIES: hypothetical protein [unclassified Tolypothrix]|uniref:hypothetical protein n=1 Tax=unclassified Tolypothrix TaxID=2649714 RepID=UPI0012D7F1E4|nr:MULTISPECIES: hypothetical protein [unclassified Tolypothrix]UYD33449.1 hypothetical protein HG267_31735 [Tolypothrix sp. PCC 7601]